MDRLLSMRTFSQVVEEGSFAGAARRLALNQAVVTRLVADLEEHLGVRLLNRTTRSMSLTEAGESYLARCRRILADIDCAEEELGSGNARAGGRVRLAVPVLFGLEMMAPRLGRFRRQHPDIVLDISVFERPVDPVSEGFDLAIIPSSFGLPNSLIARPLGETPVLLCASPSYLEAAGVPHHPQDLARHACIGYSLYPYHDQWKLSDGTGRTETVAANIVLQSNNLALVRHAARDGLGVGVAVRYSIAQDLSDGRLVHVLPDWNAGGFSLNIVYPSRDFMPRRVRSVIEFIMAERATMDACDASRADAPSPLLGDPAAVDVPGGTADLGRPLGA